MLICAACGRPRVDDQKTCDKCGSRRSHYEPTLSEIAAQCAAIRRTWTRTERTKRTPEVYRSGNVETQVVKDPAYHDERCQIFKK